MNRKYYIPENQLEQTDRITISEGMSHIANVDKLILSLHVLLNYMFERHVHIHSSVLKAKGKQDINLEILGIIHELRQILFDLEEKTLELQANSQRKQVNLNDEC